ncbi:hypothetical protein [Streptomyces sp. 8N616]|uniref:hypothetical protein n=1 Tax=Streptomyces sp. 8N616 TaxID=3457414 RepID=UPI003FD28377
MLDAAESLAITISVTAAALLHGQSQRHAGGHGLPEGVVQRNLSALRSAYLGKGATFGTWTTWLNALRSLTETHPDLVPGLRDALQDKPDEPGIVVYLNALRQERNRAAHGNKPRSQSESALRVAQGAYQLEPALAKAQFLKDVPWLLTVSCAYQPRSHTFDVVAHRAMSDHPDFERQMFTWADPVANDTFYVLSPKGPVALSPFVASRFCPQCQQMEVCYVYRADRNEGPAELKSFGRGHDISAADLGDDVRSLPDRRKTGP